VLDVVLELREGQQRQRQGHGLAPDDIARSELPVNFIGDIKSSQGVGPADWEQGCRKIHQEGYEGIISIVFIPIGNAAPPDEYGAPQFIIVITRSADAAPPSLS